MVTEMVTAEVRSNVKGRFLPEKTSGGKLKKLHFQVPVMKFSDM